MSESWFRESLYGHWRQSFLVTRELYRSTDGLQDIALFETPGFGRVLTLDGVIQVTTGDEFIYHEMLTHVPVYAHGAARSVCVVGGGDGGILRELLKHPGIETIVLVEIDAGVIEFCRQYLPTVSAGAFDDPRVTVIVADAVAYMRETGRLFDLILIDSTDPIGPGEGLFTESFYRDCAHRLTADGIVVNQNGVPFLQGEELILSWRRRRPHFTDVSFYLAAVPTYVGGAMALGWAARTPKALSLETLDARFQAAPVSTRYYTPAVHRAAFALPRYVQDLLIE